MFYSLQRLCAALHFGVGKLSSEVGREEGVAFDKTVVASLANAAFEKLIEYGGDLEAFAKHAKRSTVQADDVKLLVRRNKGLTTTSTRAG